MSGTVHRLPSYATDTYSLGAISYVGTATLAGHIPAKVGFLLC